MRQKSTTTVSLRKNIVHVLLALVLSAALLIGLTIIFKSPLTHGNDALLIKLIELELAAVGGAGAAVALVVNYRKQSVLESETLTRRFSDFTNQLADDRYPVKLAGVYSLYRLADEWDEQRQQIIDVLCGYIRQPWPDENDQQTTKVELEGRQTILREMVARMKEDCVFTKGNYHYDFRGATFKSDTSFAGAIFTGDAWFGEATFTDDARFAGTTFNGYAGFTEATFNGVAGFGSATFNGVAGFTEATFSGAGFGSATFNGVAEFTGATFNGYAGFREATFNGVAGFTEATFNGVAGFREATFNRYTGFREATFTDNAEFTGATFTRDAEFGEATFNGIAKFTGATFTWGAEFGEATFNGNAEFTGAIFNRYTEFGEVTFRKTCDFANAHNCPEGVSDPPSNNI